mgnify:CR=1 FL=1
MNKSPGPGKLVRNLAAFTEAMGVENAALIWYLSNRVDWPTEDNRDDFIRVLTGSDPRRIAQSQKVF